MSNSSDIESDMDIVKIDLWVQNIVLITKNNYNRLVSWPLVEDLPDKNIPGPSNIMKAGR